MLWLLPSSVRSVTRYTWVPEPAVLGSVPPAAAAPVEPVMPMPASCRDIGSIDCTTPFHVTFAPLCVVPCQAIEPVLPLVPVPLVLALLPMLPVAPSVIALAPA